MMDDGLCPSHRIPVKFVSGRCQGFRRCGGGGDGQLDSNNADWLNSTPSTPYVVREGLSDPSSYMHKAIIWRHHCSQYIWPM